MRREILVVAAILLDRQGRVLLVGNDWGRKGLVRYTLPGGTVEPGETVSRGPGAGGAGGDRPKGEGH
jgi:8-oxo-dGTP diphosphatase